MANQTTLRRVDAMVGAALLLTALALYIRTLAPGLLRGDGAEFQALAVSLGLAHSTGYPVYLLIAKLFTLFPLGSDAYRVNLLSAVAAALVLVLLYVGGRKLGCRPLAALVGPLALGVGRMFWWHAVMAETYALAMLLIAAILLLLVCFHDEQDWPLLFGAGALGGLGIGVHGTVVLLAPAALLFLLLSVRQPRHWLVAAGGALAGVGLALAAFVALDANDSPVSFLNSTARPWLPLWGLERQDFETPVQRIWFLLAARQFQGALGNQPLATLLERVVQYSSYLLREWSTVALVLMPLGLVGLFVDRWRWRAGVLIVGAWITQLVFVLNYNVYDVYVFYLPGYVLLALLACAGAEALCRSTERVVRSHRVLATEGTEKASQAQRRALWATAMLPGVLLLGVLLPAAPLIASSVRERRITVLDGSEFAWYPYPVMAPEAPHQRGMQLAALIEDDALVYTDWGTVFILYYVTHIEQDRTGIVVREWFNPETNVVARRTLIDAIEESLEARPVYLSQVPPSLASRYDFQPVGEGLLFRVRTRR